MPSYAQTIFAKPLDEITEADLTNYFQQKRDETLNLEFKSYTDKPGDARSQSAKDAEKIKGVLKTIDAFLNSSGGLLIWGAPEPTEVKRGEKKVKICQGPLAPVPKFFDRDDFINRIAGQISPVPVGVRMHPVPIASGGYVYLFDVPESQNKPHQNDGRYYVRMDTRTDAAPHYLVYALCHQIKTPILELEIDKGRYVMKDMRHGNKTHLELKVTLANTTPYINDSDIYLLATSNTLLFVDPVSKVSRNDVRYLTIANLLPLGLTVSTTLNIWLPADFENTDHAIDFWYGGAKSNVTQETYRLNFNETDLGEENVVYRRYEVEVTLISQVGLDRQSE